MILTPHIGGSTEEAQTDIGRFVAGKLRDFADSGHTTMSVNLPHVQTGSIAGGSRLLHVHRNVPGAGDREWAAGERHVNIESQVLSTRGERIRDHRRRRRPDTSSWSRSCRVCRRRYAYGSWLTAPRRHDAAAAAATEGTGVGFEIGDGPPADLDQFSRRVHVRLVASGAGAVKVTVICGSPPSVMKNSDSRYVNGT